jgi:hypothetical protein
VFEIEDMPRVRDQGGFGICYAVSTYYIAQHHHCANVLKGRPGYVSCVEATKNPANEFSLLGLARMSTPVRSLQDFVSRAAASWSTSTDELKAIDLVKGGNPYLAALAIAATGNAHIESEACYEFDQIVKEFGEADMSPKINALKQLYEEQLNAEAQFLGACADCFDQNKKLTEAGFVKQREFRDAGDILVSINQKIKQIFPSKSASRRAVFHGLSSKSFEEFLYWITLGDCKFAQTINLHSVDAQRWQFNKSQSYGDALEQMKSILIIKKRPFAARLCISLCDTGNFLGHAVAVSGYRQVCNNAGICLDQFKVINTWGQRWQSRFDDGWVMADTFIESLQRGQTSLGWFENGK